MVLQTWWVDGYWLGVLHGGFVVAMVAMLRTQFWAHTGAFNLLLGGQGEDDTRAELRTTAQLGQIYGWVDSIQLEHCDIDHLVATPTGWYALDTKWRSKPFTPADLDRDAASAGRAAAKARSVLRHHQAVAPVQPVIVVWGGAATKLPTRGYRHHSGVHVVPGRHLGHWLHRRPEQQTLPQAQAQELLAQLRTFRDHHLASASSPKST